MAVRVAINGFGRMGRLALRAAWGRGEFDIVAINEVEGSPETAAHLLEFDTVHGRWGQEIGWSEGAITVEGRAISYTSALSLGDLNWTGDGVDLVVDCTGRFKTSAVLAPYFEKGVKKIVVSTPVMDRGALNIVVGVNDDCYDPDTHHIVTAASCTTNCLAPVVKVVHEGVGIVHGSITTIHDVTNTQTLVDAPHKDLRRARSALNSLIPTSTGSATAIGLIYPELAGRLDGQAIRVPLLNASLTDCVFEVERDTTANEINALFAIAADGPLRGILGFETRPLVSADYLNDPRSAVVDGPLTKVIDRRQVKVFAWYDNEWGYVNRMVELVATVAGAV